MCLGRQEDKTEQSAGGFQRMSGECRSLSLSKGGAGRKK
ncbi:Uncharacterized protein dnm_028580 [Desulfonema magnum]|uniref:Uncharacterized protein n=1 Tax=Desulfonema magnum TaxID=45655 RepID=A0A975GMM0_9BACT|nr:Uncharacterized protein dnm_028580 [Desulfonema magnum]